ncbi:MAG: cation-translocating P-type ATPase [Promethearchaeota archaeon]
MSEYYKKDIEAIVEELGTSLEQGLSSNEVRLRLEKFGPNTLAEEKKVSPVVKFLSMFLDFLVLLLIGAAVVSIIFKDYIEALVIIVIVILNNILGFIQEYRAEKSLEALKALAGDDTLVIRDGQETRVDVKEIVPGDILLLWEGETVAADARIFEAHRLRIEEGILTGESMPVDKKAVTLSDDHVIIGDQLNMAFMGTTTVNGRGKAIVVKTGMDTEMGKIARATLETKEQKTPLQVRLERLGKMLGLIVVCIVAVVFISELLFHGEGELDLPEIIETSIALAVSAVPEGLAAAITLTLALGVKRMARKRAIVRKLPAVETLGSVQVICTDKTGTLTQNKMTAQRIWVPTGQMIEITGAGYLPKGKFIDMDSKEIIDIDNAGNLLEILKAGFLSSTAKISYSSKKNEWICEGDPTEGALVVAAMKTPFKLDWEESYKIKPDGEIFFDSDRKRMTIIYETLVESNKKETWAFMKGAPESMLKCCTHVLLGKGERALINTEIQKRIQQANTELGAKAFRVLAVAKRKIDNSETEYTIEKIEKNMTLLGLIAMIDPPREEVAEAVEKCKNAGIRVIMITGDHKNTAMAIAKSLDLKPYEDEVYTAYTAAELEVMDDSHFKEVIKDLDVCARASPSIKARIVECLQRDYNQIVAMTGDGVNDAPALKKADIGVAMGITGTDVAREAADMILTDDNFATIVAAVEEGRQIYDNMNSFIRFMLSSNFDEILVVFVITVLLGLPSPFLALGILWINLLTDGLPALALAIDPADPGIMKRKPRGKGKSMISEFLIFAIIAGVIAFAETTILFVWFYNTYNLQIARTVALTTSVLFELGVVFVTRTPNGKSVFQYSPINNKFIILSVLSAFIAQVTIIYVPPLASIFKLAPIHAEAWIYIFISVFAGIVILDLVKLAQWKLTRKNQ